MKQLHPSASNNRLQSIGKATESFISKPYHVSIELLKAV